MLLIFHFRKIATFSFWVGFISRAAAVGPCSSAGWPSVGLGRAQELSGVSGPVSKHISLIQMLSNPLSTQGLTSWMILSNASRTPPN